MIAILIAVTGKGGTGKTLVSAMLVLHLCKKGSLLAVDADPDSNLPEAFGVEVERTLGDIREIFQSSRDEIKGDKEIWFEAKIFEVVKELDNFDLLVMGRPEGEGCYCYTNNILRAILKKFMRHYDFVVVDCEAGLEHFSRKTIAGVNYLIVVSDTSRKGLRTAERISELMEELNINARKGLIGNKVIDKRSENLIREFAENSGFKFLGSLPYDEKVVECEMMGKSVVDLMKTNCSFVREFEKIVKNLESWVVLCQS